MGIHSYSGDVYKQGSLMTAKTRSLIKTQQSRGSERPPCDKRQKDSVNGLESQMQRPNRLLLLE